MTAPNPLDLLAKSAFFHAKLHEWGVLEISQQIEQIPGETLPWDIQDLKISQAAWNKIIHRGIKPILVFSHPQVLLLIPQAIHYYQMLAMVPKSALNSFGITGFKSGSKMTNQDEKLALDISQYLNPIVSLLIESDSHLNPREFDLWRGMTAGAQAQSAWHKSRSSKAKLLVQSFIRRRLWEQHLVSVETPDKTRLVLNDRRVFQFADEPDISVYQDENLLFIVDVKSQKSKTTDLGNIKAACQLLQQHQEIYPNLKTFLVLETESLSLSAKTYLKNSSSSIHYWFRLTDLLRNESHKDDLFNKLGI